MSMEKVEKVYVKSIKIPPAPPPPEPAEAPKKLAPPSLHTWEFNRDALIIRAYLWLWQGSEDDISFCKLWWGVIFAPLGALLRLVAVPPEAVGKAKRAHRVRMATKATDPTELEKAAAELEKAAEKATARLQKTVAKQTRERERQEAKAARGPNLPQRTLTRVAEVADHGVAFAQAHDRAVKRTVKAFSLTLFMLGAALVLAAGAAALYGINYGVAQIGGWGLVGKDASLVGAAIVVLGVISTLIFGASMFVLAVFRWGGRRTAGVKLPRWSWLDTRVELGQDSFGRGFEKAGHGITFTLERLGRGIELCFRFMADGYHSVKYRTCPKIIVRK